jgi:AcrR family transcriptional regulator
MDGAGRRVKGTNVALVNLSLLLGGGAIAIPIVLHLLLRPQPKRLVFPAVRFLREKQESHRHRLQLRHWLLLALRCLAVLFAAAALARPSVSSAAVGQWLLASLAGVLLLVVAAVTVTAALRRMGRAWVGSGAAATGLLALLMAGLILRAMGLGPPRLAGDREAPVAAALALRYLDSHGVPLRESHAT